MKSSRKGWVLLLACSAVAASAMDLSEAWRATAQYDPQTGVSQAARLAGEARRAQAASLWRPAVMLGATAGLMGAETANTGARFSAPGFGQSDGVAFGTSVRAGLSSRWSVSARQPLVSAERRAQGRQLDIGADMAELEWHAAQQALMLTTAQRYFGLVVAESRLALLNQQQQVVDKALIEAKDRFALGDKPITDTHEASARALALQAQVVAAQTELEMAQTVLAQATGHTGSALQVLAPSDDAVPANLPPLSHWLSESMANNFQLRLQAAQVALAQQEAARHSRASSTTLDLVAQAGRDRLSGNGEFGSASNTANQGMIGLQLSVPLYTGGYRSARQDEALRLEDKARSELERGRQQVGQQTRSAWLDVQTAGSRIHALAAARQASLARLDATQLGRQVGDRTTLDLLQASNDASSAELALVLARTELLLNQLRLHALAGSLSEVQLDQANARLKR